MSDIAIVHHHASGKREWNVCPFRVDRSGDGFVLRACDFYIDGVKYTIPKSITFSVGSEDVIGFVYLSTAQGNPVTVGTAPTDIIARNSPAEVQATYGIVQKVLTRPFIVGSDKTGRVLVVHAIEDPSSFDEEGNFVEPVPAQHSNVQDSVPATGEADFPHFANTRARIAASESLRQQMNVLRQKTWNQLTVDERDTLMRGMAEMGGFVQKSSIQDTTPSPAPTGSSPTGSSPTGVQGP